MFNLKNAAFAAIFAGEALAFPRAFTAMMAEAGNGHAIQALQGGYEKRAVGFDAATQYVSNTGAHAFVPPGPTDARGPCPGLNAMANHGYIPHNGVATIQQFINGTYTVFGMGLDLAAFLAVFGAVYDGDLTAWSIGGPNAALPASLGGLLAPPTGLIGSHNKYESDASPAMPDLYQYGNNYKLIMSQYEQLYNWTPLGPNGYDLSVLTPFRYARFQQSIANNPYFFNGPFTGVAVQPAGYTFVYRFMANKSAEYPEGYLNGAVLNSFHAITGTNGKFKYTPGWEKIPNNWYKRAIGDEYTIPYFNSDLTAAGLQYPVFFEVGGNTGKTNTFTPIDVGNFTGGVYNAQSLAQGNNAICFAYQFAQQGAPDFLKSLYLDTVAAINAIDSAVASALSQLACPQLANYDQSQLSKFPGYGKSYDGYSGF